VKPVARGPVVAARRRSTAGNVAVGPELDVELRSHRVEQRARQLDQ